MSKTRFGFFEPHDPVKRSSRVRFQIWLTFQVSWRQRLNLDLQNLGPSVNTYHICDISHQHNLSNDVDYIIFSDASLLLCRTSAVSILDKVFAARMLHWKYSARWTQTQHFQMIRL